MGSIRAVLCDDDQAWLALSERALRSYALSSGIDLSLRAYPDGMTMLGECPQPPDVLFCDIELGPHESGIDLVREVSRVWPSCQIVYVTNFLRYAPEVYVTEHLWFVLKERFEERLPEIMEKLMRQLEDGSKSLVVRTVAHDLCSIPCQQITALERRGRVTIITCAEGSVYQVPDRLPELLGRLPERLFARCHGSFAVGLGHVRLVQRDALVLQDGVEVPLSRRYARSFRERYLDWVDDHAL